MFDTPPPISQAPPFAHEGSGATLERGRPEADSVTSS